MNRLRLFHRFDDVRTALSKPATQSLYQILSRLRKAALEKVPHWATYPNFTVDIIFEIEGESNE